MRNRTDLAGRISRLEWVEGSVTAQLIAQSIGSDWGESAVHTAIQIKQCYRMKQKKLKDEEFVQNREFSEQLVCNGRRSNAADKSSRIFVVSIY